MSSHSSASAPPIHMRSFDNTNTLSQASVSLDLRWYIVTHPLDSATVSQWVGYPQKKRGRLWFGADTLQVVMFSSHTSDWAPPKSMKSPKVLSVLLRFPHNFHWMFIPPKLPTWHKKPGKVHLPLPLPFTFKKEKYVSVLKGGRSGVCNSFDIVILIVPIKLWFKNSIPSLWVSRWMFFQLGGAWFTPVGASHRISGAKKQLVPSFVCFFKRRSKIEA